jgi:hypothetical protein
MLKELGQRKPTARVISPQIKHNWTIYTVFIHGRTYHFCTMPKEENININLFMDI